MCVIKILLLQRSAAIHTAGSPIRTSDPVHSGRIVTRLKTSIITHIILLCYKAERSIICYRTDCASRNILTWYAFDGWKAFCCVCTMTWTTFRELLAFCYLYYGYCVCSRRWRCCQQAWVKYLFFFFFLSVFSRLKYFKTTEWLLCF